jgi:hypothetical protein
MSDRDYVDMELDHRPGISGDRLGSLHDLPGGAEVVHRRIEYTRALATPKGLNEMLNTLGAEGWDVFHVQDDAMVKGQRMFMLLAKRDGGPLQPRLEGSPAMYTEDDYVDAGAAFTLPPPSREDVVRTANQLIPDPSVCQCPAPCCVHS